MPALTKRMLIDAMHSEEMRVAIVDQNLKLEHLDIVHAGREPLKGNIYLAKVRRIEPSLQAAFVEYDHEGEKRHGFLSFAEIHPDYFRIPVADRDALREALAKVEEKAEQAAARGERLDLGDMGEMPQIDGFDPIDLHGDLGEDEDGGEHSFGDPFQPINLNGSFSSSQSLFAPQDKINEEFNEPEDNGEAAAEAQQEQDADNADVLDDTLADEARVSENSAASSYESAGEALGGEDELEEQRRRVRRQFLRNYRIQEVIKRGQVMLIQVVKEERGNKGAALTTYMSLAGRYCVLMPNSDRSGGVSRKISNPGDRRRLKETLDALNMPDGMSVILRTAGVERSADEIKRDYDYLTRLWDQIRDQTMLSIAPALIYEEANLIKRAIRDHFARDVDGIVVQGEGAFKAAKDFIRLLMPTHEERIVKYENSVPLFTRYQVEPQIEKLYEPVVQLKSGGYLVINPTEALISIDVNSGRATRDRHIEDTALRTNLEAAEEVARQLKLRDFAGLVVIDFIDMEDNKHNQQVERKMKEAMRGDRARLQIGRISGFGLMEMSRQRLRASLLETNFEKCPHCIGTGTIRSADSAALAVLRAIEDEGLRGRTNELAIDVPAKVALYLLGEKRDELERMTETYGCKTYLRPDDALLPHEFKLTVLEVRAGADQRDGHRTNANDAKRIFSDSAAELGIAPLNPEDLVETELALAGDKPRRGRGARDDEADEAEVDERPARADRGERSQRNGERGRRGRTRTRGPKDAVSGEHEGDQPGPIADTVSEAGDAETGETGEKRRRSRRGGRNRRGTNAGTVGSRSDQADGAQSVDQPRNDNQRDGRRPQSGKDKAQPNFAQPTVLEIDTTPKKGRGKPTDAQAASSDQGAPKTGWWRRWTGG